MDCKTAREQINIFDSLSQEEKDRVLLHAQNCEECKQDIINSAKLREALAELDELEPPDGLARSAIEKAKKRAKVPPYAYISVAAAAVIAVAFFATSSLLSPKNEAKDSQAIMEAENGVTMRASEDSFAAKDNSEAAGMADESMIAPETLIQDSDTAEEDYSGKSVADGSSDDAAAVELIYINVPAQRNAFVQEVLTFLDEKGIYTDKFKTDESEVISFVVGELDFDEFSEIIEAYDIEYEGELLPNRLIEMTVER